MSRSTKSRQTWDKDAMKQAIITVKNGNMGFLNGSKTFNVPQTTLRRLAAINNLLLQQIVPATLGRPPEIEISLVEYITLQMEGKYFRLTRRDIMTLAFQLALRNNINAPFSKENKDVGKDWLRMFLKRHP